MAVYPNDMLTPTYLIGAVNGRPSQESIRQQYKGLSIFPWEETPERQYIWDVMFSENNLAGIYDPRGRAIPGDELSFNSMIGNVIDIKAARTLESWSVQQLRDAGMAQVSKNAGGSNVFASMQARLKNHINKRIAWCNETVDAQIEYMAWSAAQNSLTWPPLDEDGNAIANPMPHWNYEMAFTLPFGLPALQNQAASTLTGYSGGLAAAKKVWTDHTNANPILDLEVIDQYMSKTFGVSMRGGTIYMSSIVLGHMAQNTNILSWIAGVNKEQPGARGYADQQSLRTLIGSVLGWNIELYDAQWTYRKNDPGKQPAVSRVPFLKEGKVVIVPAGGKLGGMMTAPIEATPGGQWVYGKMGWSWQDSIPPFDITMGVNATAFPRVDSYDWFVLDSYK